MKSLPDSLLECATLAARTAGDHARSQWTGRRGETLSVAAHDVKLKLDVECQAIAAATIQSRFPGHRLLGEEDAAASAASQPHFSWDADTAANALAKDGITWIVDPIDGTVNFFHGLPFWCCSVAAAVNGIVVAGAVYAPAMDLLYQAVTDRGSTCNGKPIRVSTIRRLSEGLVMTGLDKKLSPAAGPLSAFSRLSAACQKTRVMGSAALDLCSVAAGQAEAYFETGIYIWDVAAAGLIVRQAGGRVELPRRLAENRICFIGSNGLVHDEVRAILSPILDG